MQPSNSDKQLRHRTATSRAMKQLAKQRTCPNCLRQNAIKRTQLDPWTAIRKCRYCEWEKGSTVNL